jgi:hypothetical protein
MPYADEKLLTMNLNFSDKITFLGTIPRGEKELIEHVKKYVGNQDISRYFLS